VTHPDRLRIQKEFSMTSFINPGYPTAHRRVKRLELLTDATTRMGQQFKGGQGLVTLLLAGVMSALVVVADQVVNTWTGGHLMMAWVTLWAFVFAALALFAQATHGWTGRVLAGLQQWSAGARARAQDERVWAAARSDPRFMADIQAARTRAESEALALNQPMPSWSFIDRPASVMYYRPW
jgi:hypothetical protein